MRWYTYPAYFFGGACLANAIPHFVNGISGNAFPTPFATPPGAGLSPPWVNVLWGTINLVFAYLLLARVGSFEWRRWRHVALAGAGWVFLALSLSRAFARVHNSPAERPAGQSAPTAQLDRGEAYAY